MATPSPRNGHRRRVVALFQESDLVLNLETLTNSLNQRCLYLQFIVGKGQVQFANEVISGREWRNLFSEELLSEFSSVDSAFVLTARPFDDNYFFHGTSVLALGSLYGWRFLTSLPITNGLVYFLADLLALDLDASVRHRETTGCIFDFLGDKTGVDQGMRFAGFCSLCLMRLSRRSFTEAQSVVFADLQRILNDLGSASKWNRDILAYWEDPVEALGMPPGRNSQPVGLDFIPEADPANQIIVTRTHIDQLCSCYFALSEGNLSSPEKGRRFEQFVETFLGLIRGWQIIDRDARLTDCEIDFVYDISSGPNVLVSRMGHNIYVECKFRTERSDVRDISHFIQNLRSRNLTAGIYLSFNGITGYSPDDWRRANSDAYRRIIDARRMDGISVLPLVAEDIEAIRAGTNLVQHLQDLLNRFVLV